MISKRSGNHMGDNDSGHPLIEFTQGFLEGLEDDEPLNQDDLEDGSSVDVREKDSRDIPDPPSLNDVDISPPGRDRREETGSSEDLGAEQLLSLLQKLEEGGTVSGHEDSGEEDVSSMEDRVKLVMSHGAGEIPQEWAENVLDGVTDISGSPETDKILEGDLAEMTSWNYLTFEEAGSLKPFFEDNHVLRSGDVEELYSEGEISEELRDRLLILFGENLGSRGISGEQRLEVDREEVVDRLEQMMKSGQLSWEEEHQVSNFLESGQGRPSVEEEEVEMTGKFPDQGGGEGGRDPELEKLDEMLERFRD